MIKPAAELTKSDFSYHLPENRIRQERRKDTRDNKLLIRSHDGHIQHKTIKDLPDAIPEQSLIIVNDSRVIPSRIPGQLPTGGKIEIFLLEETTTGNWLCMGKPAKKLKVATKLEFPGGLNGEIIAVTNQGQTNQLQVRFSLEPTQLSRWLEENAYIPLPPYIKRANPKPAAHSEDNDLYQTAYANAKGSVAAPTAGLHLNKTILSELDRKGCRICPVTLHVGAGTFLPVKTENLSEHLMHSERYLMPQATYEAIKEAKNSDRKIIVVGTTSLRCLEDFFGRNAEKLATDAWHRTDIFIFPRSRSDIYQSSIASALMTNFHQPNSSLLMLVASLIGFDQVMKVYSEALDQGYEFLSYGDSSLLWF